MNHDDFWTQVDKVLSRSIENSSHSIFDDFIRENAKKRSEVGYSAKIVRKLNGETCDWCRALVGVYQYGEEPKEVYQRHDNCDCTVEYFCEKGRQGVWENKKSWVDENDDDIKERLARLMEKGSTKEDYYERIERIKKLSINRPEKESSNKWENNETRINRKYIKSSKYRKKFDAIENDKNKARKIYRNAVDILEHRDGTNYEDLVFITRDGKVFVSNDFDIKSSCRPTRKMFELLEKEKPNTIIGIHNHPNSSFPSFDDFMAANVRKYDYGLVCCHNGTIYKYKIKGDINVPELIQLIDEFSNVDYTYEIRNRFKRINIELEKL